MHHRRLAALAAACVLAALVPATATPRAGDAHWLTPDLIARVDAAGARGVPLPADVAGDAATAAIAFAGIRPGTLLLFVRRTGTRDVEVSNCTANFVFQETAGAFDPSQQLYLGTAGHCIDATGEAVTAVAVAPGTTTPVVITVGTVVLTTPAPDDFALIAIDPALNSWVSPSVAYWGGPTGVYGGSAGGIGTMVGYGGYAGGAVPRAGELTVYNSTQFRLRYPGAVGDSGGPVLTAEGEAVGEISEFEDGTDPLGPRLVGVGSVGPSLPRMLALSGKALSTCPTRTPWPLAGCPPL
ncbi:MAG TPA: hypothetical protein VNA20_18130 [Frankiaceae bacterium]|nr:hypothetical protein [Frankiaceae bacterium]